MDNFDDANINGILRLSYIRLKDRFINYFLAWIIVLLFHFIYFIPLILGSFIYKIFGSSELIQIFVLTYSLIGAVILTYFSFWSQLAMTNIMINQVRMGPISSYKYTRPLVKNYFIFNVLLSFFFLLLLPIFVSTLFIGLFFWYIYLSFCAFIYLEKNEKGLNILWRSQTLVQNKKVIFLYVLVIFLITLAIEFVIPSKGNILLTIFKQIFSFVMIPFSTSFMYEVYKNIEEPTEIKPPRKWFIAGIIGWIVILLGLLIAFIFFRVNIWRFYNSSRVKPTTTLSTIRPTPTPVPIYIGRWSLDQNSLLIDMGNKKIDSLTKNNFLMSNSVNLVEGKIEKAVRFSGNTDSYVQLPKLIFIDNLVEKDFSVSLWVNRLSKGNNALVSTTNNNDGGFAIIVGNLGEIYCRTSNGYSYVDSYTDYIGGYVATNSGWHHLEIVRKNNNCDIYVDGINRTQTRGNHSIVTKNENQLTVGRFPLGESAYDSIFQGDIDDIKIYNYSRTSEEIKQDMIISK